MRSKLLFSVLGYGWGMGLFCKKLEPTGSARRMKDVMSVS